ncbi:MAG: sigma factor-like helix-turn-helix DNA-binding protein [Eubacteriales bacterium]|nr:sigma factor-like helix-turn-helix DNA-binding protein [Eubacteriales bacterium]
MKNTPYKGYLGPRLPRDVQWERVQQVIRDELTDIQRRTLTAYYLDGQTLEQIARDRGIHKSTACRTLHRAENRLRRFLKY